MYPISGGSMGCVTAPVDADSPAPQSVAGHPADPEGWLPPLPLPLPDPLSSPLSFPLTRRLLQDGAGGIALTSALDLPAGAANATASRSVGTAEFLSLLADARYRFPPEDQASLCRWVAPILHRWTRWPDGVQLRWDLARGPTQPDDLDPRTEWVLRLRPADPAKDGACPTGLHAEWEGAHPATAARDSRRPPDRFTPQPGDLFDALAQAAVDHWSARTQVRVHGCEVDGMELRRALADGLQTATGAQWGTPVLTRSLDPIQPQPQPPWIAPTVAPPATPPVRLPVTPRAPSLFRPWLDDTPSAAKQQKLAVLPRQPTPPVDAAGEMARTLRDGGWCEALEHLVPSLITRLPVLHRLHQYYMQVCHSGRITSYGSPSCASGRLYVHWEDNGAVVGQFRDHPPTTYPPSPNAFLRMLLGASEAGSATVMPRVREELARLIECNPVLARVRLALFNKNMPGDQDVLLRVCFIGNTLTMAGEQLLDPDSAQRNVEVDDLVRWYQPEQSARHRTPARLRSEGISLLDAHRYAGPLRPTPEGQKWLKRSNHFVVGNLQTDAEELFREQIPALRYAFKTLTSLISYLSISKKTYQRMVGDGVKTTVDRFYADHSARDLLVLPADTAPFSRGSS